MERTEDNIGMHEVIGSDSRIQERQNIPSMGSTLMVTSR